jgi:hypothetical protein
VTVNPGLITGDNTGQEGCIGGEKAKLLTDVDKWLLLEFALKKIRSLLNCMKVCTILKVC